MSVVLKIGSVPWTSLKLSIYDMTSAKIRCEEQLAGSSGFALRACATSLCNLLMHVL